MAVQQRLCGFAGLRRLCLQSRQLAHERRPASLVNDYCPAGGPPLLVLGLHGLCPCVGAGASSDSQPNPGLTGPGRTGFAPHHPKSACAGGLGGGGAKLEVLTYKGCEALKRAVFDLAPGAELMT